MCFRKPSAIHSGDQDVDRLCCFMVKALASLEFELAIYHFKTTIVYGIDVCITRIRIGHIQAPDDGTYFILSNRVANQHQRTGSLVDIRNHKGESLCCVKSTAIRGSYGNLDLCCCLIVKTFAISELKLVIFHFKTTIVYGIGMCITRIRIGHTQYPDGGSGFILFNCLGPQFNSTGSLVDICNRESESFCYRKPAAIHNGNRNIDRVFCFIVKALAIYELKLVIHHFKTSIVYSIDMCITHIRIGHTQYPDGGSYFILFNRAASQCQRTGSLIDVCNNEGEILCCVKSTAIRGRYGNLDRLCCFMIKTFAIYELKLAIQHFKTTIVHGIDMCITHIRIGHLHCSDDSSHLILFNRFANQRYSSRGFVYVRNSEGENLFFRKPAAIDSSHFDIYLRRCFMIKTFAIYELKLAILLFKTSIVYGIDMCITHIRIGHTQCSNDGSIVILVNRFYVQFDGSGSIVDICNRKSESFCYRKSATIHSSNRDVDRLFCFIVKALVSLDFELATHHFKTIIVYGIGMCVTIIRVGHFHCSDDSFHLVFFNRFANQRYSSRGFVYVRDSKGESSCYAKLATICSSYFDIYRSLRSLRSLRFMIKTFAVSELKLATHHFKTTVVHGIEMCITHILINRTQAPDDGSLVILVNCFYVQFDSTGSFDNIRDCDGENLCCNKPDTTHGSDRDGDQLCCLMVKAHTILEFKLISFYYFKTNIIYRCLTCARFDRHQHPDGSSRIILVKYNWIMIDGKNFWRDGKPGVTHGFRAKTFSTLVKLIFYYVKTITACKRIPHIRAGRTQCSSDNRHTILVNGTRMSFRDFHSRLIVFSDEVPSELHSLLGTHCKFRINYEVLKSV